MESSSPMAIPDDESAAMEIVCDYYGLSDDGKYKSAKRKFLELGKFIEALGESGSEIDSDRRRNKEPKLCVDTEAKQTKPRAIRISEMGDEELLNILDEYEEGEEITKETLQKIREYMIQLHESEGFEIDTWPGSFFGVTSIIPVVLSKEEKPEAYAAFESLAKFAMDEHNKINPTGFEFEQLERVNVYPLRRAIYYLTFSARDQSGTHKTFQAEVMVNMWNDDDRCFCFCRPKPRI